MYDELEQAEKPPPPPPCAICAQPALEDFWETHLCDGCIARWQAEAPKLQALEHTHAAKHPEDVEAAGVHQWTDQKCWFILKPGVVELIARDAAAAWLKTQQAKARAA